MSTIYIIRDNLVKTIEGKEAYLAEVEAAVLDTQGTSHHVAATVAAFLKININELKVILHDVNTACSEFNLMSWEVNPERMGQ